MKSFVVLAALFSAVLSVPFERRDVDPNLVPDFGFQAGLNPTGTGDCDGITGANGQPIKIPCRCPPSRDDFLRSLNANVAAGHAVNNPSISVSFPTDNSKASQLSRILTALVTLQNLQGPGVGCPAASTTFVAQQKAIQALPDGAQAPPAAPAAPPAAAPPAQNNNQGGGVPVELVPQFGLQSGLNPTGTGDCDGVAGANGQPIKIPCFCPPSRDDFIASLNANVRAGHAVNNPSIQLSFPTDNSKASQLARITASLITLQNLRGPGVGCPASSTTFVAQQKAIQALADNAQAPPAAPAAPPAAAPAQNNQGSGVPVELVPQFGLQSGLNPTGTGDCDGVAGANGQPIKIPCFCPPSRDDFIASLNANVRAGHAVNNPSIQLSFPTDNSKASQLARITASLITLQNLRGPGVGCPASSTTFVAQQKAIQALPGRRSLPKELLF